MRKHSGLNALLSIFSLATVLLSAPVGANAQDRLPQTIAAGSARVAIAHNVPGRAKGAQDMGLANTGTSIGTLSLRFQPTAAQSKALDQLLSDQLNPSSPRYHQWLTPEQFGAEFGMSTTDLATAKGWLESEGFKVTGVARGRMFITFSGTIGQVNSAFGIQLHTVSTGGETHFSNLADPTLPSALAGVVQGVTGLNDFRLKPSIKARKQPAKSNYYGGTDYGNLIAPADFSTIYDTKPLLAGSVNGTGIKIAVAGQTDIAASSITAFRTAAGLSTNLPTVTLAGTDPGTSADDLPEAMLDTEWSGAIAPSASIVYVNGVNVFDNSVTMAIDSNLAPIITVSYGLCESGWGQAEITSYNTLFKQANAQGQTMVGPAGDSGAADCYDPTTSSLYATTGVGVDFPASSPYVTGVGGTEFNEGSGAYWSTTNTTGAATALSYIPEQPWNETYQANTSENIPFFGLEYGGAGGGGSSQYFAKPLWQVGTGVPADYSRDVPDVAFNGAANHDGYLVCVPATTSSIASCTNGFADSTGNFTVYGGTSVSTPSFAGILALLEQKLKSTGLGNVNPTIYGLANSTYYNTVFHDVTSGNNSVPCTLGSTDCAVGDPAYNAPNTIVCPANSCSGNVTESSVGYLASTGYDLASGWGSMDVNNMVADWMLVTPEPTTSGTVGAAASSTTLTTATTSVTTGTSLTLTATVASAATGTTATPTGTVQLLIDNVVTGGVVALTGGTASLTYATTGLPSGTHTLSASYSGDATYAASKGQVVIDVTSVTDQDFALTPATSTVTVATGGTASGLTFTATPSNGFTGNVTFTATTTSAALNATYNFSVNPVVISGTAAGTTVLQLEAFITPTTGDARGLVRKTGALKKAMNTSPRTALGLAGSGVALAGLLLVFGPRRRRLPGLVIALVSIGILSAAGCSGNNGTATTGTSGNTNTTPGTYPLTITASGVNASGVTVSHSVTVSFVVTN